MLVRFIPIAIRDLVFLVVHQLLSKELY